jgi:HSP20 family protein
MTLVRLNNQAPKVFNEWVNRLSDDSFFQDGVHQGFPPVNIVENKTDYVIEVAAPGREKSDFKVQVDKNILTISTEKKEVVENKEARQVRKEFTFRSFQRSFTLDDKIDVNNIVAKYENGILSLTLVKKEDVKESAKEITVL